MKAIFISIIIGIGLFSCEKQEDYVVTFAMENPIIIGTTVTVSATIVSETELDGQGFVYSTYQYPDLNNVYSSEWSTTEKKILDTEKLTNREYGMNNLPTGYTYYYRLYAIKDGLVKYSEIKNIAL